MAERPNIVVFMTDDHAAWAARCYGNGELSTPHLDRLAAEGTRATQAFTPSPVCSPARACFFTGQIPSRHGIHDWLKENPSQPQAWLDGEPTLAQRLQQAGYRTGLVGKWHCGNSHLPQPGFDSWFGYANGQYPHVGPQRFIEDGRPVDFEGHQSPYLTDRAITFLEAEDDRPFFLFVGLVDTHSPFRGHPEKRVALYRNATFVDLPDESYSGPGWIGYGNPVDQARRQEWAAQYYAAVSTIDEQVGRVLATLRKQGTIDDTLFIYTSDHGHLNGHHGLYTKGNATVPQNFYEESIRVPLLLRHPATVAAGRTLDLSVDHCDLHATLCDYAGIGASPDRPGRSFGAALNGNPITWRESQVCEYGNARMIRTENWKLIKRYPPHDQSFGDEMYDLSAAPRETTNVIAEHPEQARDLEARLNAFFARWELPEKSGLQLADQPACNGTEPWTLERPSHAPPEGSNWTILDDY